MSILDDENILLDDIKSIEKEKIERVSKIINTPQVKQGFRPFRKLEPNQRPKIYDPDNEDENINLWDLKNDCINLNGQYFDSKNYEIPIVSAPRMEEPIMLMSRMFATDISTMSVREFYEPGVSKMKELNKIGINKINFWRSLNKLWYVGNISCKKQIKNADNIEIIDKFVYNYQDRDINKDILIDMAGTLKKQFPKLKGIMQLNTDTFILSPNTKGLKISQIKVGPDVNTEPKIYINIDGDPVPLTFNDVYLICNFDNIMEQRHLNNFNLYNLSSQSGYDLSLLLAERDRMYFIVDEIKIFFKNNPYVADIIIEQNLNLYDGIGPSNRERISLKTLIQRYDNSKI